MLRIEYPTIDVVDAIDGEGGLGKVGFAVDYCAGGEEEVDEGGVGGDGTVAEGGDAEGGIGARDVEGVFYRCGEAVEGTEGSACASEVGVEVFGAGEGGVEEGFGEAVG